MQMVLLYKQYFGHLHNHSRYILPPLPLIYFVPLTSAFPDKLSAQYFPVEISCNITTCTGYVGSPATSFLHTKNTALPAYVRTPIPVRTGVTASPGSSSQLMLASLASFQINSCPP